MIDCIPGYILRFLPITIAYLCPRVWNNINIYNKFVS